MPRLGVEVKGRIPAEEQALEGRALARLSDLGWGQRLRAVLAEGTSQGDPELPPDPEEGSSLGTGTAAGMPVGMAPGATAGMVPGRPVPDEVTRAVVQVLSGWGWEQRPVGVVALPSRRRPAVVGSLAEQISRIGRLPLLGTMDLLHGGPVGEPGGNSAFRLANVWGRIGVGPQLAQALQEVQASTPGPVLLVDDVVDSRWTMTVAARELRLAGAPGVLPLALVIEG